MRLKSGRGDGRGRAASSLLGRECCGCLRCVAGVLLRLRGAHARGTNSPASDSYAKCEPRDPTRRRAVAPSATTRSS